MVNSPMVQSAFIVVSMLSCYKQFSHISNLLPNFRVQNTCSKVQPVWQIMGRPFFFFAYLVLSGGCQDSWASDLRSYTVCWTIRYSNIDEAVWLKVILPLYSAKKICAQNSGTLQYIFAPCVEDAAAVSPLLTAVASDLQKWPSVISETIGASFSCWKFRKLLGLSY